MTRDREQIWLVVAVALFAHAVLLALIVGSVPWSGGGGGGPRDETAFAAAPFVPIPLPADDAVPPPIPPETAFGEADGSGESIASVESPDVARSPSPRDLEQAWTRQRPIFDAADPAAAAEPAERTAVVAEPFGPSTVDGLVSFAVPVAKPSERPPQDGEPRTSEAGPTPAVVTAEKASPETSGAAGPDQPSDPAERGPSDLDPFAVEEGTTFERGGIEARQGREVKLARPRVDLAFMSDATRLSGRELWVGLRVETDGDGRPRRVEVTRSSGSTVIDDAVRLAAYDSWFGGKRPDAFDYAVRFVR